MRQQKKWNVMFWLSESYVQNNLPGNDNLHRCGKELGLIDSKKDINVNYQWKSDIT